MKTRKTAPPVMPKPPKREIWTFEPTDEAKKAMARSIRRVVGSNPAPDQVRGLRTKIILKAIELYGNTNTKAA